MDVVLREITREELASVLARHEGDYAAERMAAGEPAEMAREKAAAATTEFFPGGSPAPGHFVWSVLAGDEVVGVLWIGPHPDKRPEAMWVWSIEIFEPYRGKGAGRRAMQLAETAAAGLGARELGLNVYGHNDVAIGLYRSLGYVTATMQMRKILSDQAPASPGSGPPTGPGSSTGSGSGTS